MGTTDRESETDRILCDGNAGSGTEYHRSQGQEPDRGPGASLNRRSTKCSRARQLSSTTGTYAAGGRERLDRYTGCSGFERQAYARCSPKCTEANHRKAEGSHRLFEPKSRGVYYCGPL